jgi:hypothetical protein
MTLCLDYTGVDVPMTIPPCVVMAVQPRPRFNRALPHPCRPATMASLVNYGYEDDESGDEVTGMRRKMGRAKRGHVDHVRFTGAAYAGLFRRCVSPVVSAPTRSAGSDHSLNHPS